MIWQKKLFDFLIDFDQLFRYWASELWLYVFLANLPLFFSKGLHDKVTVQ